MNLARHESEFQAAGETSLDLDELLGALRTPIVPRMDIRRDDIARCLSASEGWRDAAIKVGGAFAAPADTTRLTEGKE